MKAPWESGWTPPQPVIEIPIIGTAVAPGFGNRGRAKVKGAGARNKGKRAEREVINALQFEVDGICKEMGRERIELQRNLLQAHRGGADVFGLNWASIEVKRHEDDRQMASWWRQCLEQCRPEQTPILMYRKSAERWKVKMRVTIRISKTKRVTMDVVTDWTSFLRYFRERLRDELAAEL